MNYSSIKLKPETKHKFVNLSKQFGRQQIVLCDQIADYFIASGIDPLATDTASTNEEVKMLRKQTNEELTKFRNTIISFIRKQEKGLLKPMLLRVDQSIVAIADLMEDLSPLRYRLEEERPMIEKSVDQLEFEKLKAQNEIMKSRLKTLMMSTIKDSKLGYLQRKFSDEKVVLNMTEKVFFTFFDNLV